MQKGIAPIKALSLFFFSKRRMIFCLSEIENVMRTSDPFALLENVFLIAGMGPRSHIRKEEQNVILRINLKGSII